MGIQVLEQPLDGSVDERLRLDRVDVVVLDERQDAVEALELFQHVGAVREDGDRGEADEGDQSSQASGGGARVRLHPWTPYFGGRGITVGAVYARNIA